jgi:hypothetical protein
MYIPLPDISGCQHGSKNDDRVSVNLFAAPSVEEEDEWVRETVVIPLYSLPTYEAVARFYSCIAYPDRIEATRRYTDASQKTFEWDVWRPVKPVAHAAAAAVFSWLALQDPRHGWDERHQLCYDHSVLATLFYEDVFKDFVLRTAEHLRIQVPTCSRFQIHETVRFAIGWDE